MRPPRANPLLLTLIALALPAGAQIKTSVGADAAAGTAGQAGASFNSGGITPLGPAAAVQLSPLSLSPSVAPTLAPPVVSPAQGLTPSALTVAPRAASVSDGKSGSARADGAKRTPAEAASAPAAPAAAPAGAPFFVRSLASLGVSAPLVARLQSFLDSRHPGDQDRVYHGLGHSHEVADLTARILRGRDLPAEKKVLLILAAALHDVDPERADNTPARVAATLSHLDADDEARALLLDFSARYGFTAAQVKALIMATDFAMDPVQMKEKQDAFEAAAKAAFPGEESWALAWGRTLAFADQSSTYVGSTADARRRVEGLALEIRAQLEAVGKGPGPSDADMLAGSYKFLSVLKANPLFALLPRAQQDNFDAVLGYFQARQTPQAWAAEDAPAPSRAPPANPDVESARRFIKGIMAGLREPTERETDSLLADFFDEQGIPKNSPRAVAVRQALVPGKTSNESAVAAALDPALRRHAPLLIRLAAEHGLTVAQVESVIAKRGLLQYIRSIPDAQLENQIELALAVAQLEGAVAGYPDNAQGELMRSVASAMTSKSGKSVEEVARDGVFLYADFSGSRYLRGFVSRDPDIQGHTIAFYITRRDGKWRVDGYRQKKLSRTADDVYIGGLKSWLRSGGVPLSDFH